VLVARHGHAAASPAPGADAADGHADPRAVRREPRADREASVAAAAAERLREDAVRLAAVGLDGGDTGRRDHLKAGAIAVDDRLTRATAAIAEAADRDAEGALGAERNRAGDAEPAIAATAADRQGR